jgi:hypothetical protein
VTDDPVFAPDWRQPTRTPVPGVPESDLSVQLSAWMLLEGAATAARADVATTVDNRDPTWGKPSTELSFVISAPQPTVWAPRTVTLPLIS